MGYHRLPSMFEVLNVLRSFEIEVPSNLMDYHGLSWIIMDCHGFDWIMMDYHGSSWIIICSRFKVLSVLRSFEPRAPGIIIDYQPGAPWIIIDYHRSSLNFNDYH